MADPSSPLTIISELSQLLPDGSISTDVEQIVEVTRSATLSRPGHSPTCIVSPANRNELQAVILHANKIGLNLTVTSSSGVHRHGGISNQQENVLIDLSHWQKVDLIDRRNRVCRIEPGVTYGQIIPILTEHGMTLPLPLAPRSGKSVLASVMDRVPSTWPNKQWDASDPAGSTEFFFGNGERFRSGAAGGPGTIAQQRQSGGAQKFSSGPSQTDFHRVIQGAQGTLGILSWITLRTELKPTVQKTLLTGSERLEDLLPFVYAVQRGLLGEQTFILDRTATAMLLASNGTTSFEKVRATCPAYICLQNIAGFERLPQERLDYHFAEIGAFADKFDLHLDEQIGTISAADLLSRSSQPTGEIDWRDKLYGNSFSIFFLSTLDRSPTFRRIIMDCAQEFNIPEEEIGTYLQPINQNHACHMEFIFPCELGSEKKTNHLKQFEKIAVTSLMEAGAFFSRPYGSAAEIVWDQNPANYQLVRTVKGIFDPNRVLQRGKWDL